MFIIISFAFFFVLAGYILVRHFQGIAKQPKTNIGDDSASLADMRFSPMTGALKIDDETISYYAYTQQPEVVARVEANLRKGLRGRVPVPGADGKVAKVETTLSGWRLLPMRLLIAAILIFMLYVGKGILLPEEQGIKAVVDLLLLVLILFHILLSTIYYSMLTRWELRGDQLQVGKGKLRSAVPLKRIAALNIEIAREKLRRQARQPGFVLEMMHDEHKTRFHDMRLDNLLPLYDAIISRRPDLKIA